MDPNKVARFIGGVKLGTVQPHCPGLGPCHVRRNGRNWARFAWALHNGPVPDGMHVLHYCDNGHGGCVRREHLWLGTHAENMADKLAKGRQARGDRSKNLVIRRGERHGMAKLTEAEALEVLEAEGVADAPSLALRLGVTQRSIHNIWNGKTWIHLRPYPGREQQVKG